MTKKEIQKLAKEHGTPLVIVDHDEIRANPDMANDYREAMLMRAHATELQQAEKAHLAYYAAYASGRVDEAQQIIEALASAPRVELVQRFAHSGIETRTRSF